MVRFLLLRELARCEAEEAETGMDAVRQLLEMMEDQYLWGMFLAGNSADVAYGKINSRGARIVLDGRELYEEAEHYRVQARELEWSFPQSALILRKLAEWLESESRYDRIEAEIVQ